MKRIFCIAFISIICSFSFLTGYCSLCTVPVYGAQDQWEDLASNDQLVDAFRAYCKSRNTVIDGSLLDAVTSFTTTSFNNICNTLGIDVTLLQAELQRMYSGSGYKYAFSQLGLSTYNRIFAEFLQNNDLSVGDDVDDKTLINAPFSNGAFLYSYYGNDLQVPVSGATTSSVNLTSYGMPFPYDSTQILNLYNSGVTSFNVDFYGVSYNIPIKYKSASSYSCIYPLSAQRPFYLISGSTSYETKYGYLAILLNSKTGKIFLVYMYSSYINPDSLSIVKRTVNPIGLKEGTVPETANVYITTNNLTINNETVINEGDTYIIDSDGQPDDGGSGDDSDDDWNPVLPDVPSAGSDPSGGNTIDWPDLDLPDFNLSNFSLGDLRLKFPFSIPFDIVSILGVINAPAVAPVIQEDIPIRIDLMNVDYTIPINLDMSDSLYDNFAVLVRAVEFIGFCIGLIHLTIRLVKG